MIKVKFIVLGALKEKYLSAAANEYEKRLSAFCDFELIELSPSRLSDNPSEAEISAALQREAEAIEKKIPANSFVSALCIEGKPMTSKEFSEAITKNAALGKGCFCFIIGSSFGLSEQLKKRADLRLSFSQMTFPHQLFRIMLYEQLYRAFKIAQGGKYHK